MFHQDILEADYTFVIALSCHNTNLPGSYLSLIHIYLQSMVKWSTQIANMTHYSVESTVSCIFYNLLLYNLQTLTGDKRSMISSTLTLTDKHCQVMGLHPGQFFWQIIKAIQKNAEPIVPRENVLDTLATTLQCFLSTDNFEDALIKAVNKGYDSDTVGNILGGLAGSYYGYQAIPERWLAPLTVKEELMDVVNGFLQLWQQKGFTLN